MTNELIINIKSLNDTIFKKISIDSSYIFPRENNIIFYLKIHELLNISLNHKITIVYNDEVYDNLNNELYSKLEKCTKKELSIIVSEEFNLNIIELFVKKNNYICKYEIISHTCDKNYLLVDEFGYYCILLITGEINGIEIKFSINYYYEFYCYYKYFDLKKCNCEIIDVNFRERNCNSFMPHIYSKYCIKCNNYLPPEYIDIDHSIHSSIYTKEQLHHLLEILFEKRQPYNQHAFYDSIDSDDNIQIIKELDNNYNILLMNFILHSNSKYGHFKSMFDSKQICSIIDLNLLDAIIPKSNIKIIYLSKPN